MYAHDNPTHSLKAEQACWPHPLLLHECLVICRGNGVVDVVAQTLPPPTISDKARVTHEEEGAVPQPPPSCRHPCRQPCACSHAPSLHIQWMCGVVSHTRLLCVLISVWPQWWWWSLHITIHNKQLTATRHSSTKGVSTWGRMVTIMSLKSMAVTLPAWALSRCTNACFACSSWISWKCKKERLNKVHSSCCHIYYIRKPKCDCSYNRSTSLTFRFRVLWKFRLKALT